MGSHRLFSLRGVWGQSDQANGMAVVRGADADPLEARNRLPLFYSVNGHLIGRLRLLQREPLLQPSQLFLGQPGRGPDIRKLARSVLLRMERRCDHDHQRGTDAQRDERVEEHEAASAERHYRPPRIDVPIETMSCVSGRNNPSAIPATTTPMKSVTIGRYAARSNSRYRTKRSW